MNRQHPRIFAKAGAPDNDAGGQTWYSIKAAAGDDSTLPIEIEIYDEIGGWGIRAVDFLRDLKAIDDGKSPITVGINSLGGDVFDGIAIHNALRRLGDRVTVRIDSVAASIASVIAVGAHQVVMPENAMMMIHNPWTITWGEADDLRQTADMMDKVRDTLVASYRAKAPQLDEAELIKMLDDTTWLTAQEAVALGLADVVSTTVQLKASTAMRAGLSRLKNAPPALIQALDKTVPPPEPQDTPPSPPAAQKDAVALASLAARLCAEAGIPALADCVVARSGLADETAIRAEVDQAVAVRDLCITAKLPDLADGFIRAGLSADAARTRLFDKLVAGAGDDFDATPPPASDTPPRAGGPNAAQIYAQRRANAAKPTPLRGKA